MARHARHATETDTPTVPTTPLSNHAPITNSSANHSPASPLSPFVCPPIQGVGIPNTQQQCHNHTIMRPPSVMSYLAHLDNRSANRHNIQHLSDINNTATPSNLSSDTHITNSIDLTANSSDLTDLLDNLPATEHSDDHHNTTLPDTADTAPSIASLKSKARLIWRGRFKRTRPSTPV